ncbi:hypothetical protein D9611_005368 [Ephemerocybe angulata]|uniref:Uncharacterized protein n=1 Tax=Ephemerocybe angulata TaxID=980116 RepID=A0A8H5FD62_9AGAR|nr:hypothetical protein D9611_005368 [Tulosesus angulatus]
MLEYPSPSHRKYLNTLGISHACILGSAKKHGVAAVGSVDWRHQKWTGYRLASRHCRDIVSKLPLTAAVAVYNVGQVHLLAKSQGTRGLERSPKTKKSPLCAARSPCAPPPKPKDHDNLKQGDPVVYGRTGEEDLYFDSHEFEPLIIPGVSSALAAPTFSPTSSPRSAVPPSPSPSARE